MDLFHSPNMVGQVHAQLPKHWFHMTTVNPPMPSPSHLGLHGGQDFTTFWAQCVPNPFLGFWHPNCLLIITNALPFPLRPLPYLFRDHSHAMRQDFAPSAIPSVTDAHFVCLPLWNNGAISYHLLTKPFEDVFGTHSTLVQVYILSLTVWQLFSFFFFFFFFAAFFLPVLVWRLKDNFVEQVCFICMMRWDEEYLNCNGLVVHSYE